MREYCESPAFRTEAGQDTRSGSLKPRAAAVLGRFLAMALPMLAILLATATSDLTAQKWQWGATLGGANYQGDLRDNFGGTDGWRSAFGASLHRIYSRRFQMDYQLLAGHLGGSDKNGPNKARNLTFGTPLFELGAMARINLIAKQDAKFVPYVAGGLAAFYVDPFAFDNSGTKQKLIPLSTEGQGLSQYPDAKKMSKFQVSVPIGAGFSFRVGKRSFLDIESIFRKTFTDGIDDVSGNYPDRAVLQNARGSKAVEMSFRGTGAFPAAGTARGNSDRQDWYHTLLLRLRVPMGKAEPKVAPVVAPAVPVVADRDGDGVPDGEDACPDVAGLAKYKGCPIPDTDRDGINDEQDKCPTVPGLAKYNGCPIPDTDGDGINDEEDRCKTIPGVRENGGCPRIDFKAENIQFATGTANLTPVAKTELNKLVTILSKEYPNVRVGIEGHTDNVGKAEANQALSDKRAAAVKAYLVGKGIAATRLDAAGFGQTQPIADNATAEGRARNRRVAFKVSE